MFVFVSWEREEDYDAYALHQELVVFLFFRLPVLSFLFLLLSILLLLFVFVFVFFLPSPLFGECPRSALLSINSHKSANVLADLACQEGSILFLFPLDLIFSLFTRYEDIVRVVNVNVTVTVIMVFVLALCRNSCVKGGNGLFTQSGLFFGVRWWLW